ncbi:TonB-dependent receptor plug domain-containing protein [Spirosoma sp. BT702]|uniref:TonB-dependent receptor plug domain-containing protein n=1 Tax=Spirosoma profusum TaxID=2771354 RepID=A0A926Y206_9BACT|nr:TonB-dependent receptor plug domain-containing protein [Spirosoma profusum]MBD2700610.1 TonB-dependent receptor plug domain-containing protein [Spirosoma profusum]
MGLRRLLLSCFCFLLFLSATLAQQRLPLSVIVRDAVTKKPIPSASLYIAETRAGASADTTGLISIQQPPGVLTLYVSAVGYIRGRETVVLNGPKRVEYYLQPRATDLDEVDVRATREDKNMKTVQMGQIQLSMPELKRMPVVLGEPDILKALSLQAGVTTAGEGAGGFNVRGGRADQNLVLLDGAPLFNTSHLLGFYSNVNADLVQDVSLNKGAYSAQYGGRVSSLLLMSTRNGNKDEWRASVGLSPVSVRAVADGPIARNLTLLAGGRIAFPNYLLQAFPTKSVNQSRAFFYDGNLKLTYTPNERNTISLSGYRSQDSFQFPGDTLYGWSTNVVTGRWSYLLRPNLQLNLTGLYSGYHLNVDGVRPTLTFRFSSFIEQREGKADVFYTLNKKHRIQVGLNGITYHIQTGDVQPADPNSSIISKTIAPENARELGTYVNTEWEITPNVTLQAGLRFSAFTFLGPQTVYNYAENVPISPETVTDSTRYGNRQVIQTYAGLEPRLALRVQVAKNSAIKASLGRTRQYLNLISNTTAITPLDFWKLSDRYVPPQIADQVSLGLFQNLRDNMYEFSIETYYKHLQNQIEYRYGADLILNPKLETALLQATGRAYGVEFGVSKNKGRLTGQFNYTYARSLIAVQTPFDELRINEGRYYPAYIDRPHTLNMQARWSMSHNWMFTTNFVYYTGVPATYPDGRYTYNNEPVQDYSQRNADRIPDYHRLDVAFSKDTRSAKSQKQYGIWTLGIYNLYAHKNPYSIYFTRFNQRIESYRLSVFGTLIPSIAYTRYF